MKNLRAKILEFKEKEFKVSEIAGDFSLYQTERNEAKKELIAALQLDLEELASSIEGADAYLTADGPTLTFDHNSVQDQLYSIDQEAICSGKISISFNAIFRNLSYDAELEGLQYAQEEESKEKKRLEKEKNKREKTKRDAENRAEKARLKEQLKEKLLKGE